MKRASIKGAGVDLFFRKPDKAKPASQQASKPAKQQAGKLVKQLAGKQEFIKVTFYIRAKDDMTLEELRLKRLKAGQKADKSSLIREAINLLAKQ